MTNKVVRFAIIAVLLYLSCTEAKPFDDLSLGLQKRRLIKNSLTTERDVPFVYPPTYTIGTITMVKCFEDNPYGIDGIYCWNQTVKLDRYSIIDHSKIKVAFITHVPQSNVNLGPNAARSAIWFPLGGPGSVAHLSISLYYDWAMYLPDAWNTHDIIMYDQRGMGWSCGLSCWNAYVQYGMAVNYSAIPDRFYEAAESFRRECDVEIATNKAEALTSDECIVGSNSNPRQQRIIVSQYMGTKHAVADFEDFRVAAGYGKIDAVGISYGTVAVQVYCGMFPHRCKSMIIDSPFNTLTDIAKSARREASGRRDLATDVARICSQDPRCSADACTPGDHDCAETIRSAFTVAMDPTNWPRHVDYPYFDMYTGEYTVIPLDMPRDWFEEAFAAGGTLPLYKASVVRALLRAATGDNMAMMHLTYMALYYFDPRAKYFPLDYAMAAGANQAAVYPIVTGEDYVYKWEPLPVATSPERRENEYVEAYGLDWLDMELGATPLLFSSLSPAYGYAIEPVYNNQYQNTSKTPISGWHGDYPILILNPQHDSNCPTADASHLFALYGAQTGLTSRISVVGGGHKTMLPMFPDPGYAPLLTTVENILAGNNINSGASFVSADIPMTVYYPRFKSNSLTLDGTLAATENEFLSLIEWNAYINVLASCDKGGFIYWGTMYNATHEAITFVNCALLDPNIVVNGMALFNWASPDPYTVGSDFSFGYDAANTYAAVTSLVTGQTNYYAYLHLAGQPIQQTAIPVPMARKPRSTPVDHAEQIRNALDALYS